MENFNLETLPKTVQQGFRMTLGATSSLVESLQDTRKRDENLQRLTSDFDGLTAEWVAKGETTEQEARSFVDTLLQQMAGTPASNATVTTTATPVTTTALQMELKTLTQEIINLREEIEKLPKTSN